MNQSQRDDADGRAESTDDQRSPWVVAGVFGALGFEFVGFIVGGALIGAFIDDYFGTDPWGVIVMMFVGLAGVSVHIFHVAGRYLEE